MKPDEGLTLAQCRSDRQCRGVRSCLISGLAESIACEPDSAICVCISFDGLTFCSSSVECPENEVCASGVLPDDTVCASRLIVEGEDGLEQIDGETPQPTPTSAAGAGDGGAGAADDVDAESTDEPPETSGPLPESPSPSSPLEVDVIGPGPPESPDGPTESPPVPGDDDEEGDALTLDECGDFGTCRGRRLCVILDPVSGLTTELCTEGQSCVCSPPSLRSCTSSVACIPKEICAFGPPLLAGQSACVSRDAFESFEMEERLPLPLASPSSFPVPSQSLFPSASPSPPPLPSVPVLSPLPSLPPVGPTIVPDDTEEVVPSVRPIETVFPTPTDETPVPVDIIYAAPTNDVVVSEIPVPDFPVGEAPTPIADGIEVTSEPEEGAMPPSSAASGGSPAPDSIDGVPSSPDPVDGTPTPGADGASSDSDSEPPICFDARALAHMKPEELVFEKHNMGKVLCDRNNSCATAGHMVDFKGRVMMMRTYCKLVPCEQRMLAVNSPRFRRRLRVSSNTEGLLYTAFAARFATRGEEMALSTLSRLGL